MSNSQLLQVVFAVALTGLTSDVLAQGRAEGGIVNRDKVSAYLSSTGEKTRDSDLPRGTVVVGVTTMMGSASAYQFEESDGRVQATYVLPTEGGEQASIYRSGWFQKSDLAVFTYECGCPSTLDSHKCYPFVQSGWTTVKYSVCVKEGASKKLSELKPQWEQAITSAATGEKKNSGEKPLTNEDVLLLVRAGLGDEIVVAKIRQAPSESLDVSIDTLIRLRKEGLAQPVLDAMLKRTSQRK